MRIGNFSATVPEGREHSTGHVALSHNQTYTLRLQNCWHDRGCDAEVTIDGKPIGGFRLDRGRTLVLERSPDDNGRFTFLRLDSAEGQAAGLHEVATAERGLITVRFRPGVKVSRLRRTPPTVPWVPTYPTIPNPWRPPNPWDSPAWTADNGPRLSCSPEQEVKTAGGITTRSLSTCSLGPPPTDSSSFQAGGTGLTGHSDQSFYDVAALNYDVAEEVTINLRLVAEAVNTVRRLESTRSNAVPVAV